MSKKRPGIAPGLMLGFLFFAGFEATLLELPLRRWHPFHRCQPEQDTRDEVPFVTYQKKMPISKRCIVKRWANDTLGRRARPCVMSRSRSMRWIAAPSAFPGVDHGEKEGQQRLTCRPLAAQARTNGLHPPIDENRDV